MDPELSTFLAVFLVTAGLHKPDNVKPIDRPKEELLKNYTFIIVGAGSAGCVLANRLTENSDWNVLLIEAGGDEDAISDIPLLYDLTFNSEKDWNYTTTMQREACLSTNGTCMFPRGHVMGGSSSINGMIYVRGNKADYDNWYNLGNTGWSYEDVLPYFIKAENNTEPSLYNSSAHGTKGPLNIQYPRFTTPMREEFIKAGEEIGWSKNDYNAESQNGIGYVQLTINGPSRESTSKAYLAEIMNRKNLHIIKHAIVTKVIIDNRKARGVEYYRDGKIYQAMSDKEVILSAGAIDSPKILMLSGIGPRKELEKHNLRVISDLPVGENLQDHPSLDLYFALDNAHTFTESLWKTNDSIFKYANGQMGPLTGAGAEATAFFNIDDELETPNFQIIFLSFTLASGSSNKDLIRLLIGNIAPKSVGNLKLKSNNFLDPPLIDPNLYSDKTDKEVLIKGLSKVFDYMRTPTMKKYSPKLYTKPQPLCADKEEKDYIICVISNYSGPFYHPVGSIRMGTSLDKTAVVTPQLNVKGIENLKVIDASIMPIIPRANTNGPTIMIAEKGSDIIKSSYQ